MADNVSHSLDTVKMDVMQRALQSDFPLQMATWGAGELEKRGKANVPPRIDFGYMQDSIYHWTQKGAGWASGHSGPIADYAWYQEEGTFPHGNNPGIKGHHFMRRALLSLKTPFVQVIQTGLKRFA